MTSARRPGDTAFRRLVRATVPFPVRRIVHDLRANPFKVADVVPDLVDRLRFVGLPPLPPSGLRSRVSWTSSRDEFRRVGREGSLDIEKAFSRVAGSGGAFRRWLDFGCGCGRLARQLIERDRRRELTGVDIDGDAMAWAARHLRGRFFPIADRPPIVLPPASFDVVVANSVFTHMEEASQREWLEELHRLLRPGGLLIVTTFGPHRVGMVPNLTEEQRSELERRGFLFAPGPGPFNRNAAFHSRAFLESDWQPLFHLRDFRADGMTGFQDLSVWSA